MKFINARVLDDSFKFKKLDLEVVDKVITKVQEKIPYSKDETVVDCEGYTIVPGFIDIHIHGCAGTDTSDGTREAIENMAQFLITKGVTSFCPTTMTTDRETILNAVLAAKDCMDKPRDGAAVVGVNMEGPFIAPERKGAQKAECIKAPDYEMFKEIYDACGGIIKLVDIAPEKDLKGGFIEKAKDMCVVSIAHTTADYEQARASFDKGVTHATHLFNAMSGLSHREPGVVGAVFDDERVNGELICDGNHIHPAVLRTAFKVLGDRAVVISDSMRAAGLPEGEVSELGGQAVYVKDGKATLKDGTLAGSVANLHEEIVNLVKFGIPLERAVKSATIIPAKILGLDDKIGSIKENKQADMVILDEDLNIVAVYH